MVGPIDADGRGDGLMGPRVSIRCLCFGHEILHQEKTWNPDANTLALTGRRPYSGAGSNRQHLSIRCRPKRDALLEALAMNVERLERFIRSGALRVLGHCPTCFSGYPQGAIFPPPSFPQGVLALLRSSALPVENSVITIRSEFCVSESRDPAAGGTISSAAARGRLPRHAKA